APRDAGPGRPGIGRARRGSGDMNDAIVPAHGAKLPQNYQAAKTAIAQCERVDECADWANKMEAIASYARQSKDNSLRKAADRIQARAVRRCGELLNEIPKAPVGGPAKISGGTPTDSQEPRGPTPREQAAAAAGLSRDQAVQAIRVANVPEHA